MSYAWEYIAEEDKQRIGFDELTRPWWRGVPSRWAIDRETGNFLLNVTQLSEDTRDRQDYLFGWKGLVIPIESTCKQSKHGLKEFTFRLAPLRRPPLPPDREIDRPAMVLEFVEAVACEISMNGQLFSANVILEETEGEKNELR
jgi:hypothetical protein